MKKVLLVLIAFTIQLTINQNFAKSADVNSCNKLTVEKEQRN